MVVRAFRPDAVSIHVLPEFGGRIPMTHRLGGVFEARLNGRDRGLQLPPRGGVPRQQDVHPEGSVQLPAHAGRHGPAPRGRGPARRGSGSAWGRTPCTTTASAAWPSRCGRPRPRASPWWATSIAGTAGCTPCGAWAPRASGSSSSPRSARARATSSRSAPATAARACSSRIPYAFRTEVPPATASVVHDLNHFRWSDEKWMAARAKKNVDQEPWSVYEVHLASWRRVVEDGDRPLTYREMATALADYVKQMGFTHVELMPVSEHPFGGSWGYQVGNYYAPTARFGHPDDFRYLVNYLHEQGIGVILDWVPGHFPRDAHALGQFDGTALYEHADPRQGTQPDWGTLRLQLRPQRGAQLPHRQRALLARGVPHRRPARGRGGLDALPRLQPQAWRVGAQPLGRPRERGGHLLPARAQRHRAPQVPRRGDDRRGVHRVAQGEPAHPARAGSASTSSGTWAGCTTR